MKTRDRDRHGTLSSSISAKEVFFFFFLFYIGYFLFSTRRPRTLSHFFFHNNTISTFPHLSYQKLILANPNVESCHTFCCCTVSESFLLAHSLSHSMMKQIQVQIESPPEAASLCSAAGVPRPGAVRDGAGGGGEEQEELRGRHQHQAGRGSAGQGDVVPAGQLRRLSPAACVCCAAGLSPEEGVVAPRAGGPPGWAQELVIYLWDVYSVWKMLQC